MEEFDDLEPIPFQKVTYAINKNSDSKSCQEKRNRQQNVDDQQEIFKIYDSLVNEGQTLVDFFKNMVRYIQVEPL